jgi:hypothetical protein
MSENEKQEYLAKRRVILDTLETLFGYWDMAESIYSLVNSADVTAEIIDEVIDLIDISYKKLEDSEQLERMESALTNLKSLKTIENNEKIADSEDANMIVNNLLY